jgi:hypothetical protein
VQDLERELVPALVVGRVIDRPETADRDPEVDVEAAIEDRPDQGIVDLDLRPVVLIVLSGHLQSVGARCHRVK